MTVLFRCSVSSLIFWVLVYQLLKSLTITVDLSTSCSSISFCFINFKGLLLGIWKYVLFMNWPLYHYEMTLFIPSNILCFEVYFVWLIVTSSLISCQHELSFFTFSLFESVLKVDFLYVAYSWILLLYPVWKSLSFNCCTYTIYI